MSKAKGRALRSIDLGFPDVPPMLRFFTDVWNLAAVGEHNGEYHLRATGGRRFAV